MKNIIMLAIGYAIPTLFNHPEVVYMTLSIAAGLVLGLLVAMLIVGPSPRRAKPAAAPGRRPVQRKPRKQNFQVQHGIEIFNYPQGAMA